ncbi:MAG: thioesterase family protein [Acidimicrobiales bacterium]
MADVTTDAPSVPAGDFAADTAVTPVPAPPGTFTADLSEAWKVFYAFGGATMAVALRAAQAGLDRDDLAPVSATAVYAAPVPCGEMTIDTRILRAGRSAAQVTADLRAGSARASERETDLHLTAIFGAPQSPPPEFWRRSRILRTPCRWPSRCRRTRCRPTRRSRPSTTTTRRNGCRPVRAALRGEGGAGRPGAGRPSTG